MTASELKKLVTQVRRTDTALRHLAAQLDLNEADKASLLKAASVLSASGRQVASQAAQTRRTEEAREKAVAKATQEAKLLIAGWPVASIPDKVALCVANLMETHLRQNLESDSDNLEWSLNYWVEQALAEIRCCRAISTQGPARLWPVTQVARSPRAVASRLRRHPCHQA